MCAQRISAPPRSFFTGVFWNMCKANKAAQPHSIDTKSELIYNCMFSDFMKKNTWAHPFMYDTKAHVHDGLVVVLVGHPLKSGRNMS